MFQGLGERVSRKIPAYIASGDKSVLFTAPQAISTNLNCQKFPIAKELQDPNSSQADTGEFNEKNSKKKETENLKEPQSE